MNILDCIGNTPLLHLQRISRIARAQIYAKVETYNPTGSIHDRVALYYIQNAIARNNMKKFGCIIEASKGNLGISLAHICAQMDLRLMLCMPSSVSRMYHNYLNDLGVHLFLTNPEQGMQGALDEAAYHHEDTWGSFRIKPYTNLDGVMCYYNGLGVELLNDAQKESLHLDACICAVETGATFSGIGQRLRENDPNIFLGATEIAENPTITGDNSPFINSEKSSNEEKILEINPIFNRALASELYSVSSQDAQRAQRRLLSLEGIKADRISGANIHAALLLAQQEKYQGKNIIVIVHSNHYF